VAGVAEEADEQILGRKVDEDDCADEQTRQREAVADLASGLGEAALTFFSSGPALPSAGVAT
jgi:hypothetical protein